MDESSLDTVSDENKVLNYLREDFDSFIEEKYENVLNKDKDDDKEYSDQRDVKLTTE